jgi:serine/threonine protein kinase
MQDRQRDRPGRRNIIELFDAFDIESPNGIHRCLVLEVADLHFAELTELEGYDFDDAVYLFKQCVETVEYVHSMGISHGGMSVLSPALCVVEADFRGRP